MDDTDLLEIAETAIFRVSTIAVALGQEKKIQSCGELGAQLFIICRSLDALTSGIEDNVQGILLKLLADVERVCSVTFSYHFYRRTIRPERTSSGHNYSCMRDIATEDKGSSLYVQTEQKIRYGLEFNTMHGTIGTEAIKHFRKFSNRYGVRRPVFADIAGGPKATSDEYSTKVKMLVHKVLSKHAKCQCYDQTGDTLKHRQISRLLLKVAPSYEPEDHAEFEMLFSLISDSDKEASDWSCTGQCLWQDVQVLVPREKKVSFPDREPRESTQRALERVKEGEFCDLISLNENSRLCLTIQGGRLFKNDPRQLEQIVEKEPGITLSQLLNRFSLSIDMKGVLAYILAQSVWQFYESDWMNTRWNSDTIHFIPGIIQEDREREAKNGIFAWKPYFSVRFGEKDPDFGDRSPPRSGEIHQFPRIRALGIMLVEIGIGRSLENITQEGSETAKKNMVWQIAKKYCDSKKPWPSLPLPNYRTAVKHCLEPDNFTSSPRPKTMARIKKKNEQNENADDRAEEYAETIKERRKVLFEKVVSPLEEIVRANGWITHLSALGPIEMPPTPQLSTQELEPTISRNGSMKSDLKQSNRWLSDIASFNDKVINRLVKQSHGRPPRIKIAVIDTGFEETVPFFHSPLRRSRLKAWKDWVEDSPDPTDIEGHGTHIAIEWAWKQWQVDIISMSFGYRKDQAQIKREIFNGLLSRDEEILFFAAAANSGVREPEMFPARLAHVISMRGANAKGYFPDFNPPPKPGEAIIYGTLGVDVPGASIHPGVYLETKSGSSIATAVAAGMAAVLLEYASLKCQEGQNSAIIRKLKTRQGMLSMFESLADPSFHNERHRCVSLLKLRELTEEQRWAKFEDTLANVNIS
ncbi:hypothetical protein N7497_006103 [Penicillium chrysogenum]|nr:hypothetical protein N7497_006103 [Penicillium chrysogenum]